jgi:hypothetical protein
VGDLIVRVVSLETAKSIMASLFLGKAPNVAQLGSISLREHQQAAARRIHDAIREFGGAVLCDPAGTGKTFTALACIPSGQRALVVGPAILREMWMSSAKQAQRDVHFCSYEAFSRTIAPPPDFRFVILDEAHHARNPVTIRYRALSETIRNSPTLMLTATPIHNRRADLLSLLQLVMGERAHRLSPAELSRCVIRRDALTESLPLPRKLDVVWHDLENNDDIARRILSLPPALPPSDGDDGGALIAHSLIRQWASSDAALRGALRRRLLQAEALGAALKDGTWPSRAQLASWSTGDNSVQLSFAGLLANPIAGAAKFLDIVLAHRDGIAELLGILEANAGSDHERAGIIGQIITQHPHERIVAFSAYADTIGAMFRLLSPRGRVAALTGSGGRVAGGRISRTDAIEQFAPLFNRRSSRKADEIRILLTSELLREGVNLQNASVVIQLDVRWGPARLEQRIGRIARIGSAHSHVVAHAFRPHASAELSVHIEKILSCKSTEVLSETDSRVHAEEIRKILASWSRARAMPDNTTACAARAAFDGFIAIFQSSSGIHLVTERSGEITDSPSVVLCSLRDLSDEPVQAPTSALSSACGRLYEWIASTSSLSDVVAPGGPHHLRESLLRCIASAIQSARTHDRARIAILASIARERLGGNLTHHNEVVLREHLAACSTDVAWLEKLIQLIPPPEERHEELPPFIHAMIVCEKEMRCRVQGNGDGNTTARV